MKQSSLTMEIAIWAIILVPFAYLAFSWNQLPDQVPIHFDLKGEVNGWGSKFALVVLFSARLC
ncbi:DUF1648 domain-containing protein [Pontibacter harenae]|uniref:DUF1648 domain-containing protein n=1 Tax=Pontibacter harenae TaxID=2894083 RepID=UPI001E558977|nr:DUF1648 domain-containing protein [Pontibacter harenae]MCC9168731.1 DUF1648 domain-containing protein [Pontibacter harenae]